MKMLTVKAAIALGLQHSSGNERHIYRNAKSAEQFERFLHLKHPSIRNFAQLNPGVLRGYVKWLLDRDISPTTARNYLNPIRLAARTIEENAPDQFNPLFFRRICPTPRVPAKRHLTPDRLTACIAAAKQRGDHTAVLALILGGVCGLRLMEIVNLRPEDFDEKTGLLHIHDSKNRWSTRLIPLPSMAADYLRMFLIFNGFQWRYKTHETFSKALRRTINRMHKATGDETYNMLGPKDCGRKTCWNTLLTAGCKPEVMRAYLGHAPASVAERHYLDIRPTPDDLPDYRERKIRLLRREIVDAMEKAMK